MSDTGEQPQVANEPIKILLLQAMVISVLWTLFLALEPKSRP